MQSKYARLHGINYAYRRRSRFNLLRRALQFRLPCPNCGRRTCAGYISIANGSSGDVRNDGGSPNEQSSGSTSLANQFNDDLWLDWDRTSSSLSSSQSIPLGTYAEDPRYQNPPVTPTYIS